MSSAFFDDSRSLRVLLRKLLLCSSSFWILIVFVVLIGIAIFHMRPMDDMADYVLEGGGRWTPLTSALSPAYGR